MIFGARTRDEKYCIIITEWDIVNEK